MTTQPPGPAWIDVARRYIGLKEISGPRHEPIIVKWGRKFGIFDDETAWCKTFIDGVLEEAGKKSAGTPAARSALKIGVGIDRPAYGAIVVFWRGSPKGWKGHVGFIVGKDRPGNLMVLGGNQGDAVSIKPFNTSRVLGYRWPGIAPYPERYDLPILNSAGQALSTDEA